MPKFLVNADGTLGERNDVRCVSLEHKLGIHASPTCVMRSATTAAPIGYLVGEENRGLAYMFTMMNNARLSVGIQGVGIAERAYQQARRLRQDRVQAKRRSAAPSGSRSPIIRPSRRAPHADDDARADRGDARARPTTRRPRIDMRLQPSRPRRRARRRQVASTC